MREIEPTPEFEEKVRQAVSVSGPNPAFVSQLRGELVRRPAKTKPQWMLRPAWAIAITLIALALIASGPRIVKAIQQVFGYVPGLGLVDTSSDLRVLAEPASVTKEGVTLTITQAIVYPDHVQIVFESSGIAPEDDTYQAANFEEDPTAFCGYVNVGEKQIKDGDPMLRLPDGTVIERLFGSSEYPENVFYGKPVFKAAIPADVTELTFVLKCIAGSRLNAVPENWEVPLKLIAAPAGTVVGEPVIEIVPSQSPAEITDITDLGITVRLEKVVPQNDVYSFFFSITPQQPDESLLALFPASAYLIDSTGGKVWLNYNRPWNIYETVDLWELQTTSRPAYGPYTLVIDTIFAYYNNSEPGFEFDPGSNPQTGQSWPLNQAFTFGGQEVKITSAQVVEGDFRSWGLSETVPGLQFTFESVDGKTPIRMGIADYDAEHNESGQVLGSGDDKPSTTYHAAIYYENGIPANTIPVTITEAVIPYSGDWELQWADPNQTGESLLNPGEMLSSSPGASGVTASVEKVVRLNEGYLFFLGLTPAEQSTKLSSIEPGQVSVIDSTGKKSLLSLDAPNYWYAARPDTLWQFQTKETIAEGPIQLVIEKATARYNTFPLDTPPSAEIVEANSFTFDAGQAPEIGQTWVLNQAFEIGGYSGKVVSVKAVSFDPSEHPEIENGQGYGQGYEFTVQSDDPTVQMNLWLEITPDPGMWEPMLKVDGTPGPTFTQTILFTGDLPKDNVKVTFYGISVWLDDAWTIDWTLPE